MDKIMRERETPKTEKPYKQPKESKEVAVLHLTT